MGSEIEVSPDMDIQNALAHYGVKGMKWGKTKIKPTNDEIKTARNAITEKRMALDSQGRKMQRAGKKTREAERQKYEEMKIDFLKDPDRATSLRLTTGQKTTRVVLSAVGFYPVVGAYTAGQVAARKTIEAKQRKNSYDN